MGLPIGWKGKKKRVAGDRHGDGSHGSGLDNNGGNGMKHYFSSMTTDSDFRADFVS